MELTGTIKMVRRVGGIMGELGRGPRAEKKLNVEILAVGPMFQELDQRWLYLDTKKAYRHEPTAEGMVAQIPY